MTKFESNERRGSPAASPEDVVSRLRGLTRAAQDCVAVGAHQLGLGTTEFVALVRASDADGVTGARLARAFGMRSSSVTGLADRLEAQGLIVRRPHPTDRRAVVLLATRRGRSTVTRALGPLLEHLLALAGELDADERAVIARFLDRVGEELRAPPPRAVASRRAGAARRRRPGV
jgi:DNA-binding MarR family transcriptional regulator